MMACSTNKKHSASPSLYFIVINNTKTTTPNGIMKGYLLRQLWLPLWITSTYVSGQHIRRHDQTDTVQSTFDDGNRDLTQMGIVGGSVANAGEFPWFVAFEPMVKCGGTLIAPNRVLTAAHCVTPTAPHSVRVGPSTLDNGKSVKVSCAEINPNFRVGSDGTLSEDLAIIKLKESITTVEPIQINSNMSYPSKKSTPLSVIGFGATSEGGTTSSVLKKVGTFFVPIKECQNTYPEVEFGTQVCCNVNNQGDCQGDSGGPLFDANKLQIGIVSFGYGCARSTPDVYAAVAKHYDWIQAQIENDECNSYVPTIFDRILGFFGLLREAAGAWVALLTGH